MKRIAVISDSAEEAGNLRSGLAGFFDAEVFHLDELPDTAPDTLTLVDVNLRDPERIASLKRWLKRRPAEAQVIFSVNRESHLEAIQAYATGATGLVARPIDGRLLICKLSGGIGRLADAFDESAGPAGKSIVATVNALQNVFAAALSGGAPDIQLLNSAGTEVIVSIEEQGLTNWLDIVRKHHSQTYQHCLIVTAVAVSFGRHLGFREADKQRLASAGLLHDIGKAKIPLEILEKPGPLNDAELAVMRAHPELGLDALRDAPGLQPEMVDMVLHHHEYLDGSGYPHGLQGGEIRDLVRAITIADVYGALIERRSYKAPLSGSAAYQLLEDMPQKLDKDLVREFRPIALSVT